MSFWVLVPNSWWTPRKMLVEWISECKSGPPATEEKKAQSKMASNSPFCCHCCTQSPVAVIAYLTLHDMIGLKKYYFPFKSWLIFLKKNLWKHLGANALLIT